MIKINLIEKKNTAPIMILGIDLKKINFKLIIFSLIGFYIVEIFFQWENEEKIANLLKEIQTIEDELATIEGELTKFADLETSLDQYTLQIEQLKKRSIQVDEIVKDRFNPEKLLEKMARSAPDDLWFNELEIKEDKTLRIKGQSYKYKSIGDLISSLNETQYFKNKLDLVKTQTEKKEKKNSGSRIESYEIVGTIESFEIKGR